MPNGDTGTGTSESQLPTPTPLSVPLPESLESSGAIRENTRTQLVDLQRQVEDGREISTGQSLIDTVKSWVTRGAEWLKEKLRGTQNDFLSMIVVLLDEVLHRTRPDENQGVQERRDLLPLANGIQREGTPEERLQQLERERMVYHKKNSVREFTEAIQQGRNVEFDLRMKEGSVVIRHNREAQREEVTFDQYLEVMRANPGWNGNIIQLDVKDRNVFPRLREYLDRGQVPENFTVAISISTFDPVIAEQIGEYNRGRAPEGRIPIVFIYFPLTRYSNLRDARRALAAFNDNRGMLDTIATPLVGDRANDPLAEIDQLMIHTSYQDFLAARDQEAEHILALSNPFQEIPHILELIVESGGYIDFPYDPATIELFKQNATESGINLSRVQCGFIGSYDDLYDALMHRDQFGNRVGRLTHDLPSI